MKKMDWQTSLLSWAEQNKSKVTSETDENGVDHVSVEGSFLIRTNSSKKTDLVSIFVFPIEPSTPEAWASSYIGIEKEEKLAKGISCAPSDMEGFIRTLREI